LLEERGLIGLQEDKDETGKFLDENEEMFYSGVHRQRKFTKFTNFNKEVKLDGFNQMLISFIKLSGQKT